MKQARYSHVTVDAMPPRRGGINTGRWNSFRDVILNDIEPDGKPERFTVPNRKEAEAMRSAAQNTASVKAKSRGKHLPWPLKVQTATEPIDGKAGRWYVYVGVYTPQ
jgi:hypothetical protein